MDRVALLLLFVVAGCGRGELTVEPGDDPIVIDTSNGNGTPNNTTPNNTTPNNTTPNNTTPNNTTPNNTTLMCGQGEAMCNGVCLNVTADDANCGDCNVVCDGGRVCMASACACEIGDFCGGACVDTTANSAHCGVCDNQCPGGEACVGSTCRPVTEVEAALIATNAARSQPQDCGSEGMFAATNPLMGDPELHKAAQAHADDMAANNFFSHTGSDGSSFVDRIARTNFSGQPGGENIAGGGRTAEATIQQWLDSDGHCGNMMNPSFTKIGIGYAAGGQYGTLWVQVFGR